MKTTKKENGLVNQRESERERGIGRLLTSVVGGVAAVRPGELESEVGQLRANGEDYSEIIS